MATKEWRLVYAPGGTGTSDDDILIAGYGSISITGIGTATIVLQRFLEGENEGWQDVDSFTANQEDWVFDPVGHRYRFKCTAFTSGAIKCILEKT